MFVSEIRDCQNILSCFWRNARACDRDGTPLPRLAKPRESGRWRYAHGETRGHWNRESTELGHRRRVDAAA